MNSLIKFALIGAGGYLLYKAFGAQISTPAAGLSAWAAANPPTPNYVQKVTR